MLDMLKQWDLVLGLVIEIGAVFFLGSGFQRYCFFLALEFKRYIVE